MNTDITKLSRTIANSLYQKCNEGESYNSTFETPKWGYLVTLSEGPSFANASSVNTQGVAKFVEQNLGKIPHPVQFFTVWKGKDTGFIHFDLQEQCANKDYAIRLAKTNGRTSIWDVENKKKVSIKS